MCEPNSQRHVIKPRDLDILQALFECRVMSLRQVCDIHFSGRMESAKKCIQKLKRDGYIKERDRKIGEPSLLHLRSQAFPVLQESGRLSGFPNVPLSKMERRSQVSEATLKHELAVGDVRAAFYRAIAKSPHLVLSKFRTWPLLYQFTAHYICPRAGRRERVVKPDAFVQVRDERETTARDHRFFLEIDRSSESQEVIAQKAASYADFYISGGMALRLGANGEDYRKFPFRVLMVFQNEERRNNAAERLLRNVPPVSTQVWLTTFDEAISDPLGPIWIRPKDYQTAIRGTKFEKHSNRKNGVYARQSEREAIVRATIQTMRLLD